MTNHAYEYATSFLIYAMSVDQETHEFSLVDRLLVDVDSATLSKLGGLDGYVQMMADGLRETLASPGSKAVVDMLTVQGQLVYLTSSEENPDFVTPPQMQDILSSLAYALKDSGHFEVSGTEIRRTDRPLVERYENPPTVAVMLVETTTGVLVIRRGLKDGYGKLALPGGYQVKGETWQQAAAREVLEETGLSLDPDKIVITDLVTVGGGSINLAFGRYTDVVGDFVPEFDVETLSVERVNGPVETAFPAHTKIIEDFYASRFRKV